MPETKPDELAFPVYSLYFLFAVAPFNLHAIPKSLSASTLQPSKVFFLYFFKKHDSTAREADINIKRNHSHSYKKKPEHLCSVCIQITGRVYALARWNK